MAITKTGRRLIKYSSRWNDFIAGLSPESIKRLDKVGIRKSKEDYLAGRETANDGLIARSGYTATNDSDPSIPKDQWYEANADCTTKTINNNISTADIPGLQNPHDHALAHAIITSHEAYEALSMRKAEEYARKYPDKAAARCMKNYLVCGPKDEVSNIKNDPEKYKEILESYKRTPRIRMLAKRTGMLVPVNEDAEYPRDVEYNPNHQSIDVLLKERKLLDSYPYPDEPIITFMKKLREDSGETRFLDRLGRYGDPQINPNPLERFNKKNERELRKNWRKFQEDPKAFADILGDDSPALKPIY